MQSSTEKFQKECQQRLVYQINRYRDGDKEAFSEIFNQYFSRLYRFLLIFTHHSSFIEDILQETFLKVAVHLDTLQDEKKFKAWIFTICRNTAINYKKKEDMECAVSFCDSSTDEPSAEENAIREERDKIVREALARLTEEQRTVIILSRYEGMDYKEIANIMNRNENAIKALTHRAMTRLGEFLARNRNGL